MERKKSDPHFLHWMIKISESKSLRNIAQCASSVFNLDQSSKDKTFFLPPMMQNKLESVKKIICYGFFFELQENLCQPSIPGMYWLAGISKGNLITEVFLDLF